MLRDQLLHEAERHNCSSEQDKFQFRFHSMADPTIEPCEHPNVPQRSVITSSDFEIYLDLSPSEPMQDFNNAEHLPVPLLPTMLHCLSLKFLYQCIARVSVDIFQTNRGPSPGQRRRYKTSASKFQSLRQHSN
jgi:hypothetical protein